MLYKTNYTESITRLIIDIQIKIDLKNTLSFFPFHSEIAKNENMTNAKS